MSSGGGRSLLRRACLAASVLFAALATPVTWADEGGYRFSPVNQYDINLTAAYWNPIINFVSEKSGVKLAFARATTSLYENLESNGIVELVGLDNFYETIAAGVTDFLGHEPPA